MKEELKRLKEELKEKIYRSILEFERKTGLRVTEVKPVGGNEVFAVAVKIELKDE